MRFEIEKYKDVAARLDDHDIDYGAFRDEPLAPEHLRCIRYMHDVEHHTVCYLRDLLVTRAHRDPTVTTFLTIWAFEEMWHGDALGRVLEAHGEAAGPERISRHRHSLGWKERLGPIPSMIGSVIAKEFTAVHMTWGAVNEWSTQSGYARLSQKAGHPVLTELLKRIMRQEGRHIDFYASQANERLDRSEAARRITRFALRKFWTPVGAGVMPPAELSFLVRYLFADDEGLAVARRIDRRVQRLPGLDGLTILEDARGEELGLSVLGGGVRSAASLAPDRSAFRPYPRAA